MSGVLCFAGARRYNFCRLLLVGQVAAAAAALSCTRLVVAAATATATAAG